MASLDVGIEAIAIEQTNGWAGQGREELCELEATPRLLWFNFAHLFSGVAAVVALKYPLIGLGICISCLSPDPPGTGK